MTDPAGTAVGAPGAAEGGLLDLMLWLSPAFPVGGFTYSHGLEWAIEDGTVTDAAGLEAWLGDVLAHGAGRNDMILFGEAFAAAAAGDLDRLAEVVELAAALQPTRERRLETTAQGAAFMKAIGDIWPTTALDRLAQGLAARLGIVPWTYAVAVAVAAAVHGLGRRPAALATLQAFAAAIVSAGVRAVPLGQTEGLRIMRRAGPGIVRLVDASLGAGLDALGGVAIRADIASMKHETQYTRLFRS